VERASLSAWLVMQHLESSGFESVRKKLAKATKTEFQVQPSFLKI
jgi:hypothetical protein